MKAISNFQQLGLMARVFVAAGFLVGMASCSKETAISSLLRPQESLHVGESMEINVVLSRSVGDEMLRWSPRTGKAVSSDPHALSCTYTAVSPGEDKITVEVLRDGHVITSTSTRVKVSNAAPPGAETPLNFDGAEIEVTIRPPFLKGGPERLESIGGRVVGVTPNQVNLVVYAFNEGQWSVQPYDYAPITDLDQKGTWESKTHLGMEYAILLVRSSYANPPTLTNSLPRGPDILKVLKLREEK